MSVSRPIIETSALTKRFGAFPAVDAISLTILPGEIFGLIGSTGAGKSTLIGMLTTLLPPSSGKALVAGFDIVDAPAEVRAHIGRVSRPPSTDGGLTTYENLLMSVRLHVIPRRFREARIRAALETFNLVDDADKIARVLSGGAVRRLEIAQAMIHEPAVLFIDEPTAGLDPVARRDVWSRIRDLRDRLGTTIVLTTRLMDEAAELCGRIGVMRAGRLVMTDTPRAFENQVGPDASLDEVFALIVGDEQDVEDIHPDERQDARVRP